MNSGSTTSSIIAKLQDIIADPSQIFLLVLYFGIAVVVLHFLLKTISFIFRLILAAVILGAIIWFFF